MTESSYVSLVDLKGDLRAEHRIKDGVDYSIIEKQNERTLTCHEVYLDTILEVAKRHGVTFKRALTYGERQW